ncbi:NUDIX domain-containing protein, partial [Staphylococcus epidermidis]|uniref:NUDIX domain-containing protein n=1 Tax=Staphylococcus epidermidis TaxID=1282 RepID=UPI0039DF6278
EWLRDAAVRELEEETKIKLPTATLKNAIRAREIFDDPNRSLRGRTITVAHLIRLDDTKPLPKVKGSDDAAKAFWLPLHEARKNSEMWFEDH